MIVLDTNVVAEPMRRIGDPAVAAWLDRQAAETLYLTSTSLSELLVGIEILPDGKRKKGLGDALAKLLERLFAERVLPFDKEAAMIYASMVSTARKRGRVISVADAQIAAIAVAHGYSVATRDAGPFEVAGVPVVNPWGASRA